VYFARPSSSFGYYRGNPVFAGDTGIQGPQMSGTNVFSQGQGMMSNTSGAGWTPTILYLFVLVILEMFVFAWIGRQI
jgi:hypothetical protein